MAFGVAQRAAEESGSLLPPKHILNAPTRLMKQEGYGKGYAYDHDEEEAFSGQNYFPDGMARQNFYAPTPYGFEAELKARLNRFAALRAKKGAGRVEDSRSLTMAGVETKDVSKAEDGMRLDRWFKTHYPAFPTAGSRSCCAPGR